MYECGICGSNYSTPGSVRRHMLNHQVGIRCAPEIYAKNRLAIPPGAAACTDAVESKPIFDFHSLTFKGIYFEHVLGISNALI